MMNLKLFMLCGLAVFLVVGGTALHAQSDSTIKIYGKKFAPGAEVYYDSAGVRKRIDPSKVQRIDSKTIESIIPPWLLQRAGQYPITVKNPSPTRGGSNVDTLRIQTAQRTDTAIWFRYTSIEQLWHERIGSDAISSSDSLFITVSGNPVIERQTVESSLYRNGSFTMSIEKQDDPLMDNYTDPNVAQNDETPSNEKIEIDATAAPAVVRIRKGSLLISEQQLDISSLRPLFDAAAANISQQYPGVLGGGDTTTSKILVATARSDGHTVIPITGDVATYGRGRFRIMMDAPATNLLGFSKPAGRKYVIRVDTEKNYIESVEVRNSQNALELAIYYKVRDDSMPSNPAYELVMVEHYYALPNSDIRMKFTRTQVYETLETKNTVLTFKKPLPTR